MEWLRKKCCPPEDKSMEELIKLKEITEAVIDAYNKDITLLSLNLNCSLLIPSRENTLKKLIRDTKNNLDKRNEELSKINEDIKALEAKKANGTIGNGGAEEPGPSTSTLAVAEETPSIVTMDLEDTTLAQIEGDEDQQSPEDVNSLEANFGSEADYFEEYDDFKYGNCTLIGSDLVKSPQKGRKDKTKQQHNKDIFGGHIYTESELIKSQERKLAQDICYIDMIMDDLVLEGLFTNVEEYYEAVTTYESCTEEEYFSAQED